MAVREIGTDIKLTGEKEFNDGMKAINSNLKVLKSDMAAVSATFEDNANSVEALNAKNKILQDTYDQQRVKVDALQQMYGKVAEKYGENSAQADKYKTQLNQATVALSKFEAALRENEDALEATSGRMSSYTPITQRFAAAIKRPSSDLRDLRESIGAAAREVPVLAEAMDIAGVGAKGLRLAVNGAKSTLSGLGSVAGGTAKVLGKMTVASAAALAGLSAAGVAGLSLMAEYAKESAEAAKEAKEAYDAAVEAGESAQALTANQEKWLAFSNQLDALDASVAKAKGALSGVLLPILGDLSEEGADFLNNFSQSMEEAAGNTEKQGEVIAEYIVKAAQLIKEKLPEYIALGKELFGAIGEGLSDAGPVLLDMGEDLVFDLLDSIIEFAPELGQAGITLIQKLMDGLIERGPDLLTSAAEMVSHIVSGLAQAAPDLIPAAGQLITQLLTALVQSAPQLLLAGLELVYGIISGLIDGLGDIVGSADEIIDTIIGAFVENAERFLDIGSDIVKEIKRGISEAWEGLVSWFNGIWDSLFGGRNVDVNVNGTTSGAVVDGSHANGLDYVPFDGYLARLHRGEMVLTDSEAAQYRRASSIGTGGTKPAVNLYFYAKTITEADIEMVIDVVNRKLGEDM